MDTHSNNINLTFGLSFAILMFGSGYSNNITATELLDYSQGPNIASASSVVMEKDATFISGSAQSDIIEYDPFTSGANDISTCRLMSSEEKKVLFDFIDDIVSNSESMPADFAELLNEHFSELL